MLKKADAIAFVVLSSIIFTSITRPKQTNKHQEDTKNIALAKPSANSSIAKKGTLSDIRTIHSSSNNTIDRESINATENLKAKFANNSSVNVSPNGIKIESHSSTSVSFALVRPAAAKISLPNESSLQLFPSPSQDRDSFNSNPKTSFKEMEQTRMPTYKDDSGL